MKIKIHFNRINMQRGNPRVWTAHTSRLCSQGRRVVIRFQGRPILETVYRPDSQQPRAYLSAQGTVSQKGNTVYVDVNS
jgi:hypothetical protein